MPKTRAQKEKIVSDLLEGFKRQKIAIFSDFHGVSVSKLQSMRRFLKRSGAEYKVVKKTMLDRVIASLGMSLKAKELKGEIGVAFGYEDDTSPAKILLKFSKENATFKLLGGILGGKILNDKDVSTLAKLPSKEVLISQLTGALQSPIRGLAMVLRGNMRNLVVVLQKIKNKK